MAKTDGRKQLASWIRGDVTRSQAVVARALGVSGPAVSAWIRGVSRPEQHHRLMLERLTGIAPEAWLTAREVKVLEESLRRIADMPATGTEG